jgi:nickel transport protein
MKIIRTLNFLLLVLVLFTVLMPVASAHRVHILEQINEVQIKAWYGGGTAMADADVQIYSIKDGQEELYLEGKTDADGIYYFTPKLGVSEYRAVVSATGHSDEKVIDLSGGVQQEEAEIPLAMRIFTGFGYLAGLAGMAMYLAARKLKNEHSNN